MKWQTKTILSILVIFNFAFIACNERQSKVIQLPNGVEMEFIYIAPGEFLMGSPLREINRHNDEDPVREVKISKGFFLGKFEVTQKQWQSMMGYNPSVFKHFDDSDQHPVDMVSWNECQDFIKQMNELELGTFRLPTEAEWEYACRAGTETRYYWGTDSSDQEVYQYAWAFPRAEGRSHPVGLKKPNRWGLYDMSGNVWEWCQDWRAPYQAADTLDPTGRGSGKKKIYRGGSWFNKPSTLRSANRNGHELNFKGTNSGLRLLMEL